LLIDDKGVLKLADFGLARVFGSPNRIYTHQVVTRWYRAPELLFGSRMYGTGVDLWAVGCILAELLLRVPFLPGETDLDQLTKIVQVLGTPDVSNWPVTIIMIIYCFPNISNLFLMLYSQEVVSLPDYIMFKPCAGTPFQDIFTAASDDVLQLLESILCFNPLKRCTCSEALQMDYFKNKPYPTPCHEMPRPKSSSVDTYSYMDRKRSSDNTTSIPKRLKFDD